MSTGIEWNKGWGESDGVNMIKQALEYLIIKKRDEQS